VYVSDPSLVLDRNQLRNITLDDEELMREVLTTLIDDTGRQLALLSYAITREDSQACARLAHYSKGACTNVGANRAAAALMRMEAGASRGDFALCGAALQTLEAELVRLRREAAAL
jgi:HPt (histidine-containing phosphotransfer) domain-containing protein